MSCERERVSAWVSRRATSGVGVGLALSMAALACGAEGEPLRNGGAGAAGDASGVAGTAGVGGLAGVAGTGGTSIEQPPASAPACGTEPSYDRITITGEGRVFNAPYFARVLDQGFGSPPGTSDGNPSDATADEGWLRLAVVDADAGAAPADAAPVDGGLDADSPVQVLTGPHYVGELPVTVGQVLRVTDSFEAVINLFQHHFRIVLEREDEVVLFHQASNMRLFGTFDGFTLARGDAVCATPSPNLESRCADIYRHNLEVTVPGGATATLAPGQLQAVGSYRVLNVNTDSVTRIPTSPANSSCADLGTGSMTFTAMLQPGAQ